MTYASLSEVYGTDFSNLVNPTKQEYATKKSNPNVINHNRSTSVNEIKNQSMVQQEMDYDTHMRSFDSVDTGNIYRERAWNNGNEMSNMLSPKEHLKQSLLKDRKITTESMIQQEPDGYSHMNPYKTFERTKCDDMFFHLDTCRRCQNKLKKRVIRYFNLLKEQNNNNLLLPGTSGMDSELFIDVESKPEPILKKEVKENFTNKNSFDSKILLLLFGLFIIYSLDSQK